MERPVLLIPLELALSPGFFSIHFCLVKFLLLAQGIFSFIFCASRFLIIRRVNSIEVLVISVLLLYYLSAFLYLFFLVLWRQACVNLGLIHLFPSFVCVKRINFLEAS